MNSTVMGIATLFVTHDQEEALAISDRICVMRDGRVEQVGTPQAVYRFPSSPFVARFVGKINELHVDLSSATTAHLRGHQVAIEIPSTTLDGGEARLLVRPEDVRLVSVGESGAIRGTISDVHFGGATTTVDVAIAETRQTVRVADITRAMTHGVGDEVGVLLDTQRALIARE